MDTPRSGGDGGDMAKPGIFGAPESFDGAFEIKRSADNLGEAAWAAMNLGIELPRGMEPSRGVELPGGAELPGDVELPGGAEKTDVGFANLTGEGDVVRDKDRGEELNSAESKILGGAEIPEFLGLTESRALADDGSTEGKIDKDKILSFDGDVMDKESLKQVEKVLKETENNPFELDNARNKMMTEGLRDNYGRIFGDDGADNAGADTGKIMEFSELRNMQVARQMQGED